MRREKRTYLAGAAGKYGAAPFIVYLIRGSVLGRGSDMGTSFAFHRS
jgi:hypothetical protein